MPQTVNDDKLPARKHAYGSFGDRYPEYLDWLDGKTWELSLDLDLGISKEQVQGFRASLRYQAQTMGLALTTKQWVRETPEGPRRVLLVRAD